MCRLHFYANAHKATDSQARTLQKKSFAGCSDNMVADNIPDRDVGADRVHAEAAGPIAVGILDSARRLPCPEAVGVAGAVAGQCLSNMLLCGDLRQSGFWFVFLAVLVIAGGRNVPLSTAVWMHALMLMHALVLMHELHEEWSDHGRVVRSQIFLGLFEISPVVGSYLLALAELYPVSLGESPCGLGVFACIQIIQHFLMFRFSAAWERIRRFLIGRIPAMTIKGEWKAWSESPRPKSYTRRCCGCYLQMLSPRSPSGLSFATVLSHNGLFPVPEADA
jgi:hypothetical protein